MYISYQKKEGDGGYWTDGLDGEWSFKAYEKYHDQESGLGYFMEDFEGNFNFFPYEKKITKDGYYLEHLDGTEVFVHFEKTEEDGKRKGRDDPIPGF